MKLTYFGIKVGSCGENHLSIDKEFDFQPAEDKTTAEEIVEGENYKEKVKFICNKSVASINIKMDFNDYYNADSIKRIELTKEMILTAVKRIITKVDFDYGKFKEDLISLH